jgi:hypothetical protein
VNLFVNPLVISVALVVIALIMALVALRSRRDRQRDLGEVSNQWVMEHRSASGHDSARWNQR